MTKGQGSGDPLIVDFTYFSSTGACFRGRRSPIEIIRPSRYMKIKSKHFRWLKNWRFIADIQTPGPILLLDPASRQHCRDQNLNRQESPQVHPYQLLNPEKGSPASLPSVISSTK
jgi:hypothetical protein